MDTRTSCLGEPNWLGLGDVQADLRELLKQIEQRKGQAILWEQQAKNKGMTEDADILRSTVNKLVTLSNDTKSAAAGTTSMWDKVMGRDAIADKYKNLDGRLQVHAWLIDTEITKIQSARPAPPPPPTSIIPRISTPPGVARTISSTAGTLGGFQNWMLPAALGIGGILVLMGFMKRRS